MTTSKPPAQPSLSIIIASKVGAPFIDKCLSSLKDQADAYKAETIVVTPEGSEDADRIANEFPWVKIVRAKGVSEVPALRGRGVKEATGDIVFVIEEHCDAGHDWLEKGIAAHAKGDFAAVGGPIFDADYKAASDWTTYFIEYNSAIPPFPEGETDLLNDANIAYRRSVLADHLELLDAGYWPMAVHPTLAAKGARFFMVPDMVVRHLGPWDYGYYLSQRYLFSRAFAGVRARAESLPKRIIYLLIAPLMPFVLLARIGRTVAAKGQYMGRFIKTIPWIFPALVVYVFGEWIGYLLGPGDALSKVE